MSQAKRHKVTRYMRAREQAGITAGRFGFGFFDVAETLVRLDRMMAEGVPEAERIAVEVHYAIRSMPGWHHVRLPHPPAIARKLADARPNDWTRSYPRGEHVQHDPEADLAGPRDDMLDRRPAWVRGDIKHAEQRRARARSGCTVALGTSGPALPASSIASASLRESFIAGWDQRDQLEAMREQLQRSEAWATATRGLASCTVALDHERRSLCTIVMVALQASNGARRSGETRIPDRALAHRATTVAAEAIALVERVADEARRRVQGPGPEQTRP